MSIRPRRRHGHRHPPPGTWTIDPARSSLEFDDPEPRHRDHQGPRARVRRHDHGRRGGGDRGHRRRDERSRPSTRRATGTCCRPTSSTPSGIPSSGSSPPAVEAHGDEIVVEGELTIKGVTKPVELSGRFVGPATDPWGNERIGLDLAGTVDRTEFGLELERPATRRRLPPPERGRPEGELRGGQGELTMRILALSGSLRDGSYNSALARAAAELAPAGVDVEVFDGLGELPLYDADLDVEDAEEDQRCAICRERIAAADALFVVTPEYNGSISGVLKNAIDWASRPHRAAEPSSGARRPRSRARPPARTARSGRSRTSAGCSASRGARVDRRRAAGRAGAQNVFDGTGGLRRPAASRERLRDATRRARRTRRVPVARARGLSARRRENGRRGRPKAAPRSWIPALNW